MWSRDDISSHASLNGSQHHPTEGNYCKHMRNSFLGEQSAENRSVAQSEDWSPTLLNICVSHWRSTSLWVENGGGFRECRAWRELLKTDENFKKGRTISKPLQDTSRITSRITERQTTSTRIRKTLRTVCHSVNRHWHMDMVFNHLANLNL